MLFEKILKFLSKNIISNFIENLRLVESTSKCYWSILKSFFNNKKIPCIPPLIQNNQFAVDFKEKSELFNSFFAKQCTHIETGSNLPTQILCRTDESFSTINFTEDDILSIIRKLDPNKAHDMIKSAFACYKIVKKQFASHYIQFFLPV